MSKVLCAETLDKIPKVKIWKSNSLLFITKVATLMVKGNQAEPGCRETIYFNFHRILAHAYIYMYTCLYNN